MKRAVPAGAGSSPSSKSRKATRPVRASPILLRRLLALLVEVGPGTIPSLPTECSDPAKSPRAKMLALYRMLLSNFLSLRSSLGAVSELPDSVVEDFLGHDEAPVRFIGFNLGDLARISQVLSVDFVISSRGAAKLCDTRLWSALAGCPRLPTLFFVASKKCLDLVPDDWACHDTLQCEGHVMGPHTVRVSPGDDQVRAILSLLVEPEAIPPELEDGVGGGGLPNLLSDLVRAEHLIKTATGGKHVVLAAHLGPKKIANCATPKKPSLQCFQMLGAFPRPPPGTAKADLLPVVLAYPNVFYLPHPDVKDEVLRATRFQRSEDPKLAEILLPPPAQQQQQPASAQELPHPPGSACPCSLCCSSEGYDVNFSSGGQSQLPLRVELTVLEYMRMLGLATPDNVERFRKACRLSIAAFDCEAITVPVPRAASDELMPVMQVGHVRHDGSARKQQKIVLIGHADFLDEEVRFFQVSRHEGLQEVAAEYLAHVLERRGAVEAAKKELLKPVFDVVDTLRLAHERFCREVGAVGSGGYWKTLPGRLNRSLDRLCAAYVCHAYNGAR